MRMLKFIFLLSGVFAALPSLVLAGKCPNPNPIESPAWRNFEQLVTRDYVQPALRRGTHTGATNSLAFGHALGRLASAVQGQADREAAFDCINTVLVQAYNFSQLSSREDGDDLSFLEEVTNALYLNNLLRETSRGMHDNRVAQETGVTTTAPLYDFFGGKIDDQRQQQGRVLGNLNGQGSFRTPPIDRRHDGADPGAATNARNGITGSTNTPAPANLHPCIDPAVPINAYWKFYTRGFGGGQVSYNEKRDMICFSNSYSTFYGAMKHHVCDQGWKNCRLKSTSAFTTVDVRDGYAVYYYDGGKNSGVRTPVD